MYSSSQKDKPLLFDSQRVKVTPTWLTIEKTHYAIKTIARLEHKPNKPPTGAAFGVCGVATVLVFYSLYKLLFSDMSTMAATVILLLSGALWLFALVMALTLKTRHQVHITLFDGQRVSVDSRYASDIDGLLAGIRQAMAWQPDNDEVLVDQQVTRIRRRLVSAADTRDDIEQIRQDKPSLKQQLLPLMAALARRGRD